MGSKGDEVKGNYISVLDSEELVIDICTDVVVMEKSDIGLANLHNRNNGKKVFSH